MLQSDTPSPDLLKAVRAQLVASGTSLNAFCKQHRLHRSAVSAALSGQRKGPKSQALLTRFLNLVEAVEK